MSLNLDFSCQTIVDKSNGPTVLIQQVRILDINSLESIVIQGNLSIVEKLEMAVNEYEQLQQEVTKLKDALEGSRVIVNTAQKENERLRQEIEHARKAWKHIQDRSDKDVNWVVNVAQDTIQQLKQAVAEREEALRKCSPYGKVEPNGKYSKLLPEYMCNFCKQVKHTDDCDYVRLCGGAE